MKIFFFLFLNLIFSYSFIYIHLFLYTFILFIFVNINNFFIFNLIISNNIKKNMKCYILITLINIVTTSIVVTASTIPSEVHLEKRLSNCAAHLKGHGYKCCSDNCEMLYEEQIGFNAWGFENEEWCGCSNDSNDKSFKNFVTTSDKAIVQANIVGKLDGILNNKSYNLEAKDGYGIGTFNEDGSFSCSFMKTERAYCQYSYPVYNQVDKIGPMIVDFSFEIPIRHNIGKFHTGISGIYNYNDKEIRYYIIEDWDNGKNDDLLVSTFGENLGDFTIDGAKYTIYRDMRILKTPSGTREVTFMLIYSVRKTPRKSGTININAHLKQWEKFDATITDINDITFYTDNYYAGEDFRKSIYANYVFSKFTVSTEEEDVSYKCPISIMKKDNLCCSSNCTTVYKNNDGNWGFENEKWCACRNNNSNSTTTTTTTKTSSVSNPTETIIKTDGKKMKGSINDYKYILSAENGDGVGIFKEDGSFSCSFRVSKDGFCSYGLPIYQKVDRLGNVNIDFDFETPILHNANESKTGVHGTTKLQIITDEEGYYVRTNSYDFFIVEDSYNAALDFDNEHYQGDFTIDGAVYSVYVVKYYSLEDLISTTTEIHSIRKTPRKSGTVNLNAHIQQWEKLDWEKYEFDFNEIEYLEFMTENHAVKGYSNSDDIYADFNFKKFKISIENGEHLLKCSLSIRDKGYGCCSSTCKTLFSDDDGNWGIENEEWCGCINEGEVDPKCPWEVIGLGYKCCTGDCEVIEEDENGQWAIENDEWCGCY